MPDISAHISEGSSLHHVKHAGEKQPIFDNDTMTTKTKDKKALDALVRLRNERFGRDTWMASEKGRLIAEAAFGGRVSLQEQVMRIEGVSKKGMLKVHTGNSGSSVKGGAQRFRAISVQVLPISVQEEIEADFKKTCPTPSERSSWFNTEAFASMCRKFSKYHQGEIIRHCIHIAKRHRENHKGVYFNRDPMRPNEYNIGRTKRDPEKRLRDAGSKGRHWQTEKFLENVPETEVHTLLKKWNDSGPNKRGSETYILDEKAQKLIYEKYRILLPIV